MSDCTCGHAEKKHIDGTGPCCDFSKDREHNGKHYCACRKFVKGPGLLAKFGEAVGEAIGEAGFGG